MSKVKNEHYVPRIYLENFSGKKKQVYVYDKSLDIPFKTGVKNIACKKAFYDFPNQDNEEQIVEKMFSEIEGDFAKALKILLNLAHKKTNIPEDFKAVFSPYVAIQMLRTLDFRLQFRETMEKGMKALSYIFLKNNRPDLEGAKFNIKVKPEIESVLQAKFMFTKDTISEYASVLANHVWVIGYSEKKMAFYTSDNPVVVIPHKESDVFSYAGIASEDVEIAYPLDPYHILLMYHQSHYKKNPLLASFLKDRTILPLFHDNVTFYNSYQVTNSTRQIYSFDDDFNLAKKICQDNPGYTNPNRSRVCIENPLLPQDFNK